MNAGAALDIRQRRDQALVQLEQAQKVDLRIAAAQALCDLALEDAAYADELASCVPKLIGDRSDIVRRGGIRLAALTFEPEEAQGLFIGKLKDPSQSVRLEATGQLADLESPTARGALAAMLDDDSFLVRFEAARGIAQLRHGAGIDVLIEALRHPDLRYRALGAIAILEDARAVVPVRRTFEKWFLSSFDRTQAAGTLARLGDETGAAYLMARTRKKWSPDRALAVELCGEVRAAGAYERLVEIVQDVKDLCRGAAARGLGRLNDVRAFPILTQLIDGPHADDALRLDAAEGLCLLGGDVARQRAAAIRDRLTTIDARRELDELLEVYR
jgi:HEAT repeat protein